MRPLAVYIRHGRNFDHRKNVAAGSNTYLMVTYDATSNPLTGSNITDVME